MKRHRPPNLYLLGAWNMATALLSDRNNPLPSERRTVMAVRLDDAMADLRIAAEPAIESLRDLTDAVNWLESCLELGWIEDPDGAIGAAKEAVVEGAGNYAERCQVRLSGPGMQSLHNIVAQFLDVAGQVSERAYWTAVRRTERRVGDAMQGKTSKGDRVIQL